MLFLQLLCYSHGVVQLYPTDFKWCFALFPLFKKLFSAVAASGLIIKVRRWLGCNILHNVYASTQEIRVEFFKISRSELCKREITDRGCCQGPGFATTHFIAVWFSGPAEGKLTVDGGGEQGKRQLASGGRLLSVGVVHAVNEVIDSKAAITSRNLPDAMEREKIELGCAPQQLRNLVKRPAGRME